MIFWARRYFRRAVRLKCHYASWAGDVQWFCWLSSHVTAGTRIVLFRACWTWAWSFDGLAAQPKAVSSLPHSVDEPTVASARSLGTTQHRHSGLGTAPPLRRAPGARAEQVPLHD
ncbi:hypothetical protein K461DRAFT_1617 [Myriangium duriaei CBS 260.36]|uniref:Uncharacterized protein n=1 Tax=Myriangium duriaei CBS 260.36 TaxID=1168546 RepID=A0A9P4JD29_9PEZI|nr:hypothetical protein K461DRAFT_1617 [Myriangium duriaei CBS 260.36]